MKLTTTIKTRGLHNCFYLATISCTTEDPETVTISELLPIEHDGNPDEERAIKDAILGDIIDPLYDEARTALKLHGEPEDGWDE